MLAQQLSLLEYGKPRESNHTDLNRNNKLIGADVGYFFV